MHRHPVAGIIFMAIAVSAMTAEQNSVKFTQEMVDKINNMNTTWKAGLNPMFYGWTKEMYLSLVDTSLDMEILKAEEKQFRSEFLSRKKRQTTNRVIPDQFDARFRWSNCPSIGELFFQGTCSAHAILPTVGAITDRTCIHCLGRNNPILSAQEILECCDDCGQCSRGEAVRAWAFWVSHGIPTGGDIVNREGCKWYVISHTLPTPVGECRTTCETNYTDATYQEEVTKYRGRVNYTVTVSTSDAEELMQRELMSNGPFVVFFTVFLDFYSYTSGIYRPTIPDLAGRLHVKLIGWGELNGVKYWLCVNTWGKTWGYNGLFKIIRGVNVGGIETAQVSAGLPKMCEVDPDLVVNANMTVDLVLVIDQALIDSKFIAVIAQFVMSLEIREHTYYNLGIIVYNIKPMIKVHLKPYQSQGQILANLVSTLPVGGGSNNQLDLAIDSAREMLTISGRLQAAWVILPIVGMATEGASAASNSPAKKRIRDAAEQARNEGVLVSVVGEGSNLDLRLLNGITSRDLSYFSSNPHLRDLPQRRLFYTLPIFLEKLVAGVEYCNARQFENGIRHHEVHGECDSFYVCRHVSDNNPVYKHCPLGTLWDNKVLACNWPGNVRCRSDPCRRDPSLTSYPFSGNCRLHWVCSKNRTQGMKCCEPNHRFVAALQQCVADATCVDEDCGRKMSCKEEVAITFNHGDIKDLSHNYNAVDNYGVTTHVDSDADNGWSGRFTGFNHLTVAFFANNYLGNKFQAYVRFKPASDIAVPADLLEIIVTNGDIDSVEPAFFIGYNRQESRVDTIVKTATKTSLMSIDVLDDYYVNIWLKYESNVVTVTTSDGDGTLLSETDSNTGGVLVVHNALHIGGKTGSTYTYTGFHGTIDKVWVARCIRE